MATTRVVIGVDVGGTGTKAALVDLSGEVLARSVRPTDIAAGTKGVITVVEDLLARSDEVDVDVAAIGVGASGFINAETGSVTFSPNLTYDDPYIEEALKSRTGLPVIVDNDANAAAWGERAFGGAKGCDHLALITLGTGVGSGFIVEGHLIRGWSGAGAELGHIVIDPDGPECPCGLRGCLEQFVGGLAIARDARALLGEFPDSQLAEVEASAITAETVGRAATDYDELSLTVLRRAGRALGIGLSNVVNLFDPEVIVLAGSVMGAGEPFLGAARDELFRMTNAQRRRPVRIDATSLGKDAGIIGAAALAIDERLGGIR
jgi:glucokinase